VTEILTFNYLLLIRLVAAVICGGIIGWERGGTKHEAGLRTHIIVCLGAASIMVVSQCIVEQYAIEQEIMRMGAQIVSGVGFLGAGSIIMDGNRIRGITTAAGLWTTACVGIVVGAGYYIVALVVVFLMLFTMLGLRSATRKLMQKSSKSAVKVEITGPDSLKNAINVMLDLNVGIKSLKTYYDEKKQSDIAVMEILLPQELTVEALLYEVGDLVV
jgi:putative Mg2+ transporter-C (MgtC) family protein